MFMLCLSAERERYIDLVRTMQSEVPATSKDEVEDKAAEALTSVSEVSSYENFQLFMLCLGVYRARDIDFVRGIQSEVPAQSTDASAAGDGAVDGTEGGGTQGGDAEKGGIEVDGAEGRANKEDGEGDAVTMTEKEVEGAQSSAGAANVKEDPPANPAEVAVKEEPAAVVVKEEPAAVAVKEESVAKPAAAEVAAAKGGAAAAKLSVDLASLGKGGGLIDDDEDKAFVPQVCASMCLFFYVF